jgi:solute carrier family 35 (adenosine 3'-phospho 5'-phosphosulfate transporter), member B2
MAVKYMSADGKEEHFRNSLFLEFMNRILAVVVACILTMIIQQPVHTAPVYKYSYSALSNIMSSWCQYEALKYVSFPVQVLAKAAKVIPVMLMGRVVSHQSYSLVEYCTAGMISLGLFLFVISTNRPDHESTYVSSMLSGLILLAGYLTFDAFTSNWQSRLFHVYHMSSIQMMACSNMFSVLLAGVSLIEQGGFIEAMLFLTRHPIFLSHIALLSVMSAIGQLFIYYTIAEFGAVTFTIIMTVRQGFAILLSCIFYGHSVKLHGIVGVIVCFTAIFVRIFHANFLRVSQQPFNTILTKISVARHS